MRPRYSTLPASQVGERTSDLVQELHHRVRNHLQLLMGLVHVTEGDPDPRSSQRALHRIIDGLASIAAVHELLSQTPDSSLVPLHELLPELARHLLRIAGAEERVAFAYQIVPVMLNEQRATTVALVVSELITNALEHAFKDNKQGTVTITVAQHDEALVLEVRDTGPGLPADLASVPASRLGLVLVRKLVERDLKGTLSSHNDDGAVFQVECCA